jgi:hypothetical protein
MDRLSQGQNSPAEVSATRTSQADRASFTHWPVEGRNVHPSNESGAIAMMAPLQKS